MARGGEDIEVRTCRIGEAIHIACGIALPVLLKTAEEEERKVNHE
jgi:hypothetical protein